MVARRKTRSIAEGGADFCPERGPDPETGKPRGHWFQVPENFLAVCKYCGTERQLRLMTSDEMQKAANLGTKAEHGLRWG